uniref:HTH luxR-type domain-containing protein n=1 Tax=Ammonifex degensii TaxID=42838 RepID=A0A7C1FFQ6_9THEO
MRGEQHYCKLFKDWWCVASPVKNPAGRTVGYLDISLDAEKELVSTIALLRSLVELIEDKLLLLNPQQANNGVSLLLQALQNVKQKLTWREQEVLHLKLSGLKNKEIAGELSLSVLTVETHCRNIYSKLDVRNFQEFLRKFQILDF